MIKKTLWLGVVVYVFGLLWVSFFEESVPQMNNLCKQRDAWSLRVSKESAANLELKNEIEGLKNDSRYSERILRQDLLLHKKDELIILVPDDWAQEGVDS
ncbi:MAG: septum formation initiator family protein [Candidatus Coatesbacteria bacterium]|nr:septum formation initiator family protein [Candidatus Coatesbacteria bacterium]